MNAVPRVIAITDVTRRDSHKLTALLSALCRDAMPGTVMVQLRDRHLSYRRRAALGLVIRRITQQTGQWFQVNDRLDLASELEADAVHLGEGSVTALRAREFLATRLPKAWVTAAWHDPTRAPQPGADAYVLSPIAVERKGQPALGFPALTLARQTLTQAGFPAFLYALGGMTPKNVAQCSAHGAVGVATIGALFAKEGPMPLIRSLGIARPR